MMNFIRSCGLTLMIALCMASSAQVEAKSVMLPPTYQGAVFYSDVNGNLYAYVTPAFTTLGACQTVWAAMKLQLQQQYTVMGWWTCQQSPLPVIDFL